MIVLTSLVQWVLVVSNLLSLLGYVMLHWAGSYPVLLAGRTVECVGMGLTMMTTGVFLSGIRHTH